MTSFTIRKKLTDYLKVADHKKLKAIYTLVEDEIEQAEFAYPDELKGELDKRMDDYKKGSKMIDAADAKKRINKILQG